MDKEYLEEFKRLAEAQQKSQEKQCGSCPHASTCQNAKPPCYQPASPWVRPATWGNRFSVMKNWDDVYTGKASPLDFM